MLRFMPSSNLIQSNKHGVVPMKTTEYEILDLSVKESRIPGNPVLSGSEKQQKKEYSMAK